MQRKIQVIAGVFCFLISSAIVHAQSKVSASDWSVFSADDKAAVFKDTLFNGKSALMLDGRSRAVAFRKGLRFKNVRVQCDIAARVMAGIGFRAKDHQNYHFLYFRPGMGGTKEAIQYVPIYNGSLSWVLYNYPMYETNADTRAMEWFNVVIEVRNERLRVFVNGSVDPQMEINLVESDFTEGEVLLRSMFGDAFFANIYISPLPDVLSDWQISEQFPRKEKLDLDPDTKSAVWTKAKPDLGNMVNISRYFQNPNGVVIAKHTLKADAAKDVVLSFDFIGKLKIFLNGNEVYYYEKYKLDRIFAGTNSIVLHLRKGDNDLKFVSEGDATIFGNGFNAMGRAQHQNWGFIAEVGER